MIFHVLLHSFFFYMLVLHICVSFWPWWILMFSYFLDEALTCIYCYTLSMKNMEYRCDCHDLFFLSLWPICSILLIYTRCIWTESPSQLLMLLFGENDLCIIIQLGTYARPIINFLHICKFSKIPHILLSLTLWNKSIVLKHKKASSVKI